MPAELKVTSHIPEKKKIEQDEEVATRWSTGIAEVALPSKFKERNVAETEKLARKKQAEDYLRQCTANSAGSSVGYNRFQLPDQSFKGYKDSTSSALMSTTEETFLAGAAQAANFLEQESLSKTKAGQNSTDDKVMQQFKKVSGPIMYTLLFPHALCLRYVYIFCLQRLYDHHR